MGQLFSNLYKKNPYKKFDFDFEGAVPSEKSEELCIKADELLVSSKEVLEALKSYVDCSEVAGKMLNAEAGSEDLLSSFAVFNEKVPLAMRLMDFSAKIDVFAEELIDCVSTICQDAESRKLLILNTQALILKSSHLLSTALAIDEAKLMTPALQNDLSFYRRSLPKIGSSAEPSISREGINTVISFLSEQMPFSARVAQAMAKRAIEKPDTADFLAELSMALFFVVEAAKFEPAAEDNVEFLRAMAVLIIAYDSVHAGGVFVRSSQVDLRMIVKFLQNNTLGDKQGASDIVNIIRFGCNADNFRSAPDSIKSVFG